MIGLKQEEMMSPSLFALFIDDIELFLQDDLACGLCIQNINILPLLFADDMAILSDNTKSLQSSLDKLYDHCMRWELEVNSEKSKIVVFRKRGTLRENDKQ